MKLGGIQADYNPSLTIDFIDFMQLFEMLSVKVFFIS